MSSASESLIELQSTLFRRALSASGLVDGLVLHRIASEVLSESPSSPEEQDRLFAKKLVERDKLNAWQIDQLSEGRTKFTLGSYRILDSIGRGGMGHVFKGEHELLGRFEAIKVLPRKKTTPEAIAGFRHEIRAQARLDHPNLVRVSYADRDGETYFFVTEYVEGIDLRRLIRRRGPLDESLAALVVSQAAEAIDYAHRRALVHRDVKPGNLLLTLDGRVKVTDLGLAWFLDEGETAGTPHDDKKVVGTSDYLAPESIHSPSRIIPVSDVYGLGCTLYYALTGKVPFPGGSHIEKLRRHLREMPVDVRRLNPEVSTKMCDLVRHMMNKDPRQRIASAAIVSETLDTLYDESAKPALMKLVKEASEEVKRRHQRLFNAEEVDASNEESKENDSSTGEGSGRLGTKADRPVGPAELPETVGISIDSVSGLENQGVGAIAVGKEEASSKLVIPLITQRERLDAQVTDSHETLDRFLQRFTIVACTLTALLIFWAIWKYLF